MTDHDTLAALDAAIYQLENYQQQLDADGTFVGVSRQALDEVLTYLRSPTIFAAFKAQEENKRLEAQIIGLQNALVRLANFPKLRGKAESQDARDMKSIARAALQEPGYADQV